MLRYKLVFSIFITLIVLIFPSLSKAAGEVASSYNTTYEVDSSGTTTVTEKIIFKNLTDRYYPSDFKLIIGATQISDLSAGDNSGVLPAKLITENKRTVIDVSFNNQQIVGKGKEYPWTLTFKSKDFALKSGKVWQITVPKLKDVSGVEGYQLTLAVPVDFGDPTHIVPEPVSQFEAGGKINYLFNKDQLATAGIVANFGSEQLIDFSTTYNLVNNKLLPYIVKLPLPPSTDYQDIVISNIIPRPENVLNDGEGNSIALFQLERKQTIQVTVLGRAKLHSQTKGSKVSSAVLQKLTSADKYWEKDNPVIQAKLSEIFGNAKSLSNLEKARLINKFVADSLQLDYNRIKNNDFQRFGALTALNNPDKVLTAEYTDLFITLSRAANIPTRQLIGFAASSNIDVRPLSYQGKLLHSWIEFYDPASGWQMADPAWESTTGGVNYFGNVDLNHLVLERIGQYPTDIFSITKLETNFTENELVMKPELILKIDAPSEIISGLPAQAKVTIENRGTKTSPASVLSFKSNQIELLAVDSKPAIVPPIPPFGVVSYKFNIKTAKLWQSFDDSLDLKVGEASSAANLSKKISVRPFFFSKLLTLSLVLIVILIGTFYALTLIFHIKLVRRGKSLFFKNAAGKS